MRHLLLVILASTTLLAGCGAQKITTGRHINATRVSDRTTKFRTTGTFALFLSENGVVYNVHVPSSCDGKTDDKFIFTELTTKTNGHTSDITSTSLLVRCD